MQSLWLLGLVHWNHSRKIWECSAALRKQYKEKKGTNDENSSSTATKVNTLESLINQRNMFSLWNMTGIILFCSDNENTAKFKINIKDGKNGWKLLSQQNLTLQNTQQKSPYIPIFLFCLENETNGSMQSFLSTQHTLSKSRWGYMWWQRQSSESHWVLPGHCPQHLPHQLRKLGEGGPQLLLPPDSYPNLHMSPPLDLLRVWSGPAKITTLCEKEQRVARGETDPFVFEYKVYEHVAKNGRGVNEIQV